jgi:LPS-assembly lipoprotein
MKIKSILILIFCTLLLSSCGFQLRGDATFPLPLRVLYLNSNNPYGLFEAELKKALQSTGVTMVENPDQTRFILQISQSDLALSAASVGTSSQATIYNATYTVAISLTNNKGGTIVPTEIIKSITTLIVNPQQALSSTNQADLVREQLQRETINKIFAILTSKQVREAVYTHENKR